MYCHYSNSLYGYCFSALSLEIQNDFDELLTISNKTSCGKSTVAFDPPGDQEVTANGGKADLSVIVIYAIFKYSYIDSIILCDHQIRNIIQIIS